MDRVTTVRVTKRRREKLLVMLVAYASDESSVTCSDSHGPRAKVQKVCDAIPANYPEKFLADDLQALVSEGIVCNVQSDERDQGGNKLYQPPRAWTYIVHPSAIEAATEYEKFWLRREFEKQPATWCLAAFALLSLLVAMGSCLISAIAAMYQLVIN